NLNPWTEAKVDTKNPDRGPMLIIAGGKDHTVPVAISKSSFKHEEDNEGVTEMVEIADRGHALTSADGWQDVAETAQKCGWRVAQQVAQGGRERVHPDIRGTRRGVAQVATDPVAHERETRLRLERLVRILQRAMELREPPDEHPVIDVRMVDRGPDQALLK